MKNNRKGLKITFLVAIIAVFTVAMCLCVTADEAVSTDLNIDYCNLAFQSDTHILYAIKSNDSNVKLLFWSEPQDDYLLGSQHAAVSPYTEQVDINGELYTVFKYAGLTAKQMTDNVYVRACIDNGGGDVTYGEVHKYSILQYAYNKLGKTGTATTNEKLIDMLNNMLEFGASAQEYHGYKTEALATDEFVKVELTREHSPTASNRGFIRLERMLKSLHLTNMQTALVLSNGLIRTVI